MIESRTDIPNHTQLRTCRMGLWLSQFEKDQFKYNAKQEHFSSISQFVRHRCLLDTLTNSEAVDKLMKLIALKFRNEPLKFCPDTSYKIIDENNLVPPKVIQKIEHEALKISKNKKQNDIKLKREKYIAFLLTEEEKFQLKINASCAGFNTVSKFVRDRCLRTQVTNEDIVSILQSFVSTQIERYSVGSDRNLEWQRKKIKSQFDYSPVLAGLSKKKKEKFVKSIKEINDAYSKELQEELSSILSVKRSKLEGSLTC